eukprot:g83225.t1
MTRRVSEVKLRSQGGKETCKCKKISTLSFHRQYYICLRVQCASSLCLLDGFVVMASPTIQTIAKQAPIFFKPLEAAMNKTPTTSKDYLRQLRADYNHKRVEYWYRKYCRMGTTFNESHAEATQFYKMLCNPGELTYRQVGKGFVGFLQLYGVFCLGEMAGRWNVVGYREGISPAYGLEGPTM